MVWKKKTEEKKDENGETSSKDKESFNPPRMEKTDRQCVVEGCFDEKAPGQTHVCVKHVRAS